ncbi:MAG: RadC family protein [Limisphaerales bacterium]
MMDSLRMKDMVVSDRPRERLLREGQEVLSNSELLAILLRTGTKGSSALQVAQAVLQRAGGLEPLTRETVEGLCTVPGVGPDKAVTVIAALTLARRLARESAAEAPLLDTPERVVELLREENRAYEVEQLQVVLVNTRRRLLRVERLASGTLDTLLVHPREVFRSAIAGGAAALILVHNHPSGDPTPSEADIRVTRDIIRGGQLLKIEVLDHIILGRRVAERERDYVSLRELGYFYS